MLSFKNNRPEGYSREEIHSLSKIGNALFTLLRDSQKSFYYTNLKLSKRKLEELTLVIVEFAEDLINETGIWRSLEEYNKEFFGDPLPFSLPAEKKSPEKIINEKRIHYLLWNKYRFCFKISRGIRWRINCRIVFTSRSK